MSSPYLRTLHRAAPTSDPALIEETCPFDLRFPATPSPAVDVCLVIITFVGFHPDLGGDDRPQSNGEEMFESAMMRVATAFAVSWKRCIDVGKVCCPLPDTAQRRRAAGKGAFGVLHNGEQGKKIGGREMGAPLKA